MDLLRQVRIREADRRTVEDAGIPARVLMETAGRGIASAIATECSGAAARGVLILAGRGGNGGDGLVVLRVLRQRGLPARALVLAPEERLAPGTRANLETARALGMPVAVRPEASDDLLRETLPDRGVVVDALLGGGTRGPLRGTLARIVRGLRDAGGSTVVAVDIPTGLDPDSGRVPGPAVRAQLTLALAAARRCHFVHPASEWCGSVHVLEIGIPGEYLAPDPEDRVRVVASADFDGWFPTPPVDTHKGARGRLLLVAGSGRMPGAAALAARGALRAGVGLLTVAAPEAVLATMPPEAMRLPLPTGPEGEMGAGTAEAVLRAETGALAVGPGIGRTATAQEEIRNIVSRSETPLVLDADGLNAYAASPGALREGLALTPHPGEAARLLGRTSAAVAGTRLETVRELAAATGNPVALKGPGTLVATPDGEVLVNPTGGPELATGGAGDVLTGLVGALLARGFPPRNALAAGAFLHGLAGTIARERLGPEAVTASAVADQLGNAHERARAVLPS